MIIKHMHLMHIRMHYEFSKQYYNQVFNRDITFHAHLMQGLSAQGYHYSCPPDISKVCQIISDMVTIFMANN